MTPSIGAVLVIAAFLCTIAAAVNKCPLWVPVLLLVIVSMMALFPR